MPVKHLHMTDLTSFQDCRRKFYFDKIKRITPLTAKDADEEEEQVLLSPETDIKFPFTFGTCGHYVLKDYYSRVSDNLQGLWMKYGERIHSDYFAIGTSLFDEYALHYPNDFDNWEIIMVETPINVEIGGETIELTMDMLIRQKSNGTIWAVDHKFYKRMPDKDEMNMRDQFTGYVAAVRKAGYNIEGVIVNIFIKRATELPIVLQKPAGRLSTNKAQCTTYHKYKMMADLDIREMQLTGQKDWEEWRHKYDTMLDHLQNNPHPTLRREFIYKTQAQTKTWERDLQHRLKDIRDAIAAGPQVFYPNPGYQCGKCDFLRVCQNMLEGGTGQGYIDMMYREKREDER